MALPDSQSTGTPKTMQAPPATGDPLGSAAAASSPAPAQESTADLETVSRSQYEEMQREKIVASTSEQNEKGEFIVTLNNGKSYWVK